MFILKALIILLALLTPSAVSQMLQLDSSFNETAVTKFVINPVFTNAVDQFVEFFFTTNEITSMPQNSEHTMTCFQYNENNMFKENEPNPAWTFAIKLGNGQNTNATHFTFSLTLHLVTKNGDDYDMITAEVLDITNATNLQISDGEFTGRFTLDDPDSLKYNVFWDRTSALCFANKDIRTSSAITPIGFNAINHDPSFVMFEVNPIAPEEEEDTSGGGRVVGVPSAGGGTVGGDTTGEDTTGGDTTGEDTTGEDTTGEDTTGGETSEGEEESHSFSFSKLSAIAFSLFAALLMQM